MDDTIRLRDTTEKIVTMLEKYPNTRNSDDELYTMMCREYPNYEVKYTTVERMRRKIQEKGKYLPTDMKIYEMRHRYAKKWKEKMPKVLKRDVEEMITDANGQGHFFFDKKKEI